MSYVGYAAILVVILALSYLGYRSYKKGNNTILAVCVAAIIGVVTLILKGRGKEEPPSKSLKDIDLKGPSEREVELLDHKVEVIKEEVSDLKERKEDIEDELSKIDSPGYVDDTPVPDAVANSEFSQRVAELRKKHRGG